RMEIGDDHAGLADRVSSHHRPGGYLPVRVESLVDDIEPAVRVLPGVGPHLRCDLRRLLTGARLWIRPLRVITLHHRETPLFLRRMYHSCAAGVCPVPAYSTVWACPLHARSIPQNYARRCTPCRAGYGASRRSRPATMWHPRCG